MIRSCALAMLLAATELTGLSCVNAEEEASRTRSPRAYPPDLPGADEQVYRTVGDVELKAYIFTPEGHTASDSRPAIVFFFGGGWKAGSPGQFLPQCQYLASRGMVAITCDYRVRSRHGVYPQDCVRDAKAAIRWVRAHADRLGVDPDRIVSSGGSAGGHLAAATALVPEFDEGEHLDVSSKPNALALFNPAVILAPAAGLEDLFDAKKASDIRERTQGRPEEISPYHFIRADLPPCIIFHGTNDTAVPYKTVELFTEAMTAEGNRCELMTYEGQPHGFFNAGRGTGAKAEQSNKNFRSTMKQLDEFLVSLGYIAPNDKSR